MQHQDDLLPPLESSPITDLKTWKRQKTREAPRPRRPAKAYGWAFFPVPPAVWRATYSAEQMERVLKGLEGHCYKGHVYNLGRSERIVLLALIHWHECAHPEKATPTSLGRACGMARQNIRRILTRLGQARILVNLGDGRLQNLAINAQLHEWNLSQLRALRKAETAEINSRAR